MKDSAKHNIQKKDFVLPTLTFLVVLIILSGLFLLMEGQAISDSKSRYQYIAANQASILQNSVDTVLAKADTLRSILRTGEGSTDFFDEEAPKIYEEARDESGMVLKNIAVAPGGVVEKVYPLAGNESLIGFDFMDLSRAGNEEAVAAYERGELVVTQPFELVQGGLGMAGRLPIFMEDTDGKSEFWGLVTVTMDFDTLLETFKLQNLTDMGVSYRLWYNTNEGEEVYLAGSETELKSPVTYRFSMCNLTWNLDVAPKDGWVDYTKIIMEILVALAIAFLMGLLLLDKVKLRHANDSLQRLANLDSLTLCCSRHYVNMVLVNQRTGQWNDPHAKYSMVMIDIDYFKQINDTYGHETGDRAIVAVAQILMDLNKTANGDCVIRYGGDEFIVLYNDVTRERFEEKLNSIVEAVRNLRFSDVPDLRLSVSVGGEYYVSPEQSLYYDMITRADEKLYNAKEGGRDRYVI